MEPQEEPDYEATWRWICEQADEARRQAGLFAAYTENLDAAYAAQRRSSKAFIRKVLQEYDLASSINRGDIKPYIERWHPPTPPAATGSRIEWRTVSWDESNDDKFGVIYDQEAEGRNGPRPAVVHRDEAELFDGFEDDNTVRWARADNPPADGWEAGPQWSGSNPRQESQAYIYRVSTWYERNRRVGLWTRLRQSWHQVRDKYLHRCR